MPRSGSFPVIALILAMGLTTAPPQLLQAQTSTSGAEIEAIVIAIVARHFGLPEESISLETDLTRDLLADQMDIHEVATKACEALDKEVVQTQALETVADLVEYVSAAPDKGRSLALILRGGSSGPDPSDDTALVKRIFFATNREATGEGNPASAFGGQRSTLSYGTALVSVPRSHRKGDLEEPSLLLMEWKADPSDHFVLQRVDVLDWETFLGELNATLDTEGATESRDVLLFIHGYRVPFDRAAMRTAQVAVDLEFGGAPILFSWPSNGELLAYLSDREDAEWSAAHLEDFLRRLRAQSKAQRIHLVAHSMGNQVLIRALYQIALRAGSVDPPLFENVILAAPDFDAQYFTEQIAPQVAGLAKRWTLYTSQKDMALFASNLIRQSTSTRLGQPLPLAEGVDTIDVSDIEVSPWSLPEKHTYFATKARVIEDLRATLRGMSPTQRNLSRSANEGQVFWRISGAQ